MNKYTESKVIPHPASNNDANNVNPFGKVYRPTLSELITLPDKVHSSAAWLNHALNPIPFNPQKINWEYADCFMAELEERFNKLRASYNAYRQMKGAK